MAGIQIAAPSHLSFRLQGQGLQSVQMMNINRNSKVHVLVNKKKFSPKLKKMKMFVKMVFFQYFSS